MGQLQVDDGKSSFSKSAGTGGAICLGCGEHTGTAGRPAAVRSFRVDNRAKRIVWRGHGLCFACLQGVSLTPVKLRFCRMQRALTA